WGIDVIDGRVYATDANDYSGLNGPVNRKIYVYDAESTSLLYYWDGPPVLGINPQNNDMFGISIDKCRGIVYVSDNDSGSQTIQYYSLAGEKLGKLEANDRPEQPVGNAIGCDGMMYIMDGARENTGFPSWYVHVLKPVTDT